MKMRLTANQVRRTCRLLSGTFRSRQTFNPDEENMGSTTFGNVTPAMTGPALPQNIKINRAGFRRVRETVAPH
jgi:hypothetical protein